MAKEEHAATGQSRTRVTPMLSVSDAAGAIEFYKQAFGASELTRLLDALGKVSHA